MSDEIPPPPDYQALARSSRREDFALKCPFPFLVGRDELVRPMGPSRTIAPGTMRAHGYEEDDATSASTGMHKLVEGGAGAELLVIAVRKIQAMFPSMITIGRTNNNDVVLPDISVSKFHAYIRLDDEGAELTDAGSRNGTFVGNKQLEPNGAAVRLQSGMAVRFGRRSFDYLTAVESWDRLNKR